MESIDNEVRARIVAAADRLYDEGGRQTVPTVDQVRRACRADMNAVSAVMKDWRRQQAAAAPAPVVALPDKLRAAADAAIAGIWAEAQSLSNETLQNAQATFATERAEAEAIREELSAAFHAQGIELERANAKVEELQSMVTSQAERIGRLVIDLGVVEEKHDQVATRAAVAEQRSAELAHRVDDLKGELQRTHQDVDTLRAERDAALTRAAGSEASAAATALRLEVTQTDLATVRAELAAGVQRAQLDQAAAKRLENERDEAVKSATVAREEAATLAGRVTELQSRVVELLEKTLHASPATDAKTITSPAKKGK